MTLRPLSSELAEKARLELNEDPNRINDDLHHIKDWLTKQPHLRARTDDQWLIAFLRGCKYSLERTKEKLDLYYSVRNTAPEFYRIKHTDPLFNEILDLGSTVILPKVASPDAPRVTIILLMDDDNMVVAGNQFILDLDKVTMSHFLQMTPMTMKKMVVASQDALPLRMKGTHYLNTPTGFETVFNAMKSLLSAKNQSRLYVHNKNYEEMYKYIPKEILPSEYGGDGGTIKEITDYWKKKVEEYSDFLEADYQYGTDETKRRGKPKTAEDMFGLEGSFRQLNFD
ncbi:Clavesin-2 [Papilio xuthus]|uniref:Clavesin-2 n=1 Tax=Papilio xuthus TaxID=66420 RepID=A0A194PME6_PAPXU|nr:Clavesin-2 [Papilio xuthus]